MTDQLTPQPPVRPASRPCGRRHPGRRPRRRHHRRVCHHLVQPGFRPAVSHGPCAARWASADHTTEQLVDRADRVVRHVAIELDASAEQQAKLEAIVKSAVTDLAPLRDKVRTTHQKVRELLTATTVDRAAIEKLRAEQVATMDVVQQAVPRLGARRGAHGRSRRKLERHAAAARRAPALAGGTNTWRRLWASRGGAHHRAAQEVRHLVPQDRGCTGGGADAHVPETGHPFSDRDMRGHGRAAHPADRRRPAPRRDGDELSRRGGFSRHRARRRGGAGIALACARGLRRPDPRPDAARHGRARRLPPHPRRRATRRS